jgi:hypothetical protein
MRLPSRWIRRVVLAPLVVVAAPLFIGLMPPLLIAIILVASFIPRRFRWPRALLLVALYLLWDAILLIVLFVMWIASGFGYALRRPGFVRAHYAIAGFALRVLFWLFGAVLRLTINVEAEDASDGEAVSFDELLRAGTPLVVASRHAGPGDSFILVHTLMNQVGRRPRIVLKDTMQWDPAVDVLLNRLPTRFITPTSFSATRTQAAGSHPITAQIADLAQGLGPDDAFVIFPEGGNFSVSRRLSRIDRLRVGGNEALALRAEALQHVLAPQPGGINAALGSSPDADVVFIAHAGLDDLITVRDIWRALPMDKQITLHAWRIPRKDIPADRAEQEAWLYDWFARIDAWVSIHSRDAVAEAQPEAGDATDSGG